MPGRPDLSAMPRHVDAAPQPIDLTDNTNQWGAPPEASRVIREALSVARYPSMYGESLKRSVSRLVGCDESSVLTGNGSDDVLDSAIRAFAAPGDRLAYPDPTFVMVPAFARVNSVVPISVPVTPDGAMDADALLATGAAIIYLCNPNNPTGTPTAEAAIHRVIAEANGLVIIDEAYIDFAGIPGLAREAASLPNVLVCRTLSKAYGLAGLRVGYGVASPSAIETIEKSRGPYTVNALAELAAVTAIEKDAAWVAQHAAEAADTRERLAAALQEIGLEPLASRTNFLFVPTPRAPELVATLEEAGIGVRLFRRTPVFGDAMRITVAPWPVMERLLDALRRARAGEA
jgi:histidinol-phosphate aminotransferase